MIDGILYLYGSLTQAERILRHVTRTYPDLKFRVVQAGRRYAIEVVNP